MWIDTENHSHILRSHCVFSHHLPHNFLLYIYIPFTLKHMLSIHIYTTLHHFHWTPLTTIIIIITLHFFDFSPSLTQHRWSLGTRWATWRGGRPCIYIVIEYIMCLWLQGTFNGDCWATLRFNWCLSHPHTVWNLNNMIHSVKIWGNVINYSQ